MARIPNVINANTDKSSIEEVCIPNMKSYNMSVSQLVILPNVIDPEMSNPYKNPNW